MTHIARLLGAATLFVLSAPCASANIVSTFDTDGEGWTALGDSAGPVTWFATGGNPGGHVEILDAVVGGVTYFQAPAKFLGNRSIAYGTPLKFDLRQMYTGAADQFDNVDIFLSGNGLTLAYDTATNPPLNSWMSYSVPLIETAGWRVNNLSGAVASQAQMQSVLGNLSNLRIRAEFQTGPDTDSLDNVDLVPEPMGVALLLAGLFCTTIVAVRRKFR